MSLTNPAHFQNFSRSSHSIGDQVSLLAVGDLYYDINWVGHIKKMSVKLIFKDQGHEGAQDMKNDCMIPPCMFQDNSLFNIDL